MRIATTLILASVAVAACFMSALEVSGQKPLNVESLIGVPLAANTPSAASVNRRLRASDAADEEDRTLSLPVIASATTRTLSTSKKLMMSAEHLNALLRPLSKPPNIYDFRFEHPDEKLDKLKDLELAAIHRFVNAARKDKNRPDELTQLLENIVSIDETKLAEASHKIIPMVQVHDSKRQVAEATAEFKKYGPGWIASKRSIKDVFSLLQLNEEEGFIFASPKLEVLRMYIEAYNKEYQIRYTLLDALVEGFEGEAEVARILSFAQLGRIHESKAERLQDELFRRWLYRGISPDNVVSMLNIKQSKTKGLRYEDVDILVQYIRRFNNKHPRTTTNVFSCLRKNLGDREFAIQVAAAMIAGQVVDNYSNWLFNVWLLKQIKPDDLYNKVFKTANVDELENLEETTAIQFTLLLYKLRLMEQNKPKEPPLAASDLSRKASKRDNRRSAKRPSK